MVDRGLDGGRDDVAEDGVVVALERVDGAGARGMTRARQGRCW